eukprot:COSAG03_NODE_10499_length_647_cov_0.948905_1_plen_21_part_10
MYYTTVVHTVRLEIFDQLPLI